MDGPVQMSDFGKHFGRIVRQRRGVEGLTQQGLAELAFEEGQGSKSMISDLETGKVLNPHPKTVDALAIALNISPEEIAACASSGASVAASVVAPEAASMAAPETGRPTVTNMPPLLARALFGRTDAREQLSALMARADRPAALLHGMGGTGKSTLALAYAQSEAARSRFSIRWWIEAETPSARDAGLAALAVAAGWAEGAAPLPDQLATARLRLASVEGALLIFDNAPDIGSLAPWWPGSPDIACIVTSRAPTTSGVPALGLDVLALDDAVDFLLARTGQADTAAAVDVAFELGCLPLALEHAAAACEQRQLSLRSYLARLRSRRAHQLVRAIVGDSNAALGATVRLGVEDAKARAPESRALIEILACLGAAPAPASIFSGNPAAPDGLRETDPLDEAAAALIGQSLLVRLELGNADGLSAGLEAFAVHRLVRDVVRSEVDDPVALLDQAIGCVAQAFPPEEVQYGEARALCAVLLPHVDALACDQDRQRLALDAQIRLADLLTRAGFFRFEVLGDGAGGTVALRRALDLCRSAASASRVATAQSNLAHILSASTEQADLDEARGLLEAALETLEEVQGIHGEDVGIVLSTLGSLMIDIGSAEALAQAETCLRRSLAIEERRNREPARIVAIRLGNLAAALLHSRERDKQTEARDLERRALEIALSQAVAEPRSLGIRHFNLGQTCWALGDRDVAIRHISAAHAIWLEALDPDHPLIARADDLLAQLAQDVESPFAAKEAS